MKYGLLTILVVLFALNMGGSNFAASFAAAHGGRVLSKSKAQILFILFVFLGAVFVGHPVTETLSGRIIPHEFFKLDVALIVIISATVCLLAANLFHVPQSTSLVTVGSIAGAGLYLDKVYGGTFMYLLFFWILLPVIGYFMAYFLGKAVYPPRKNNFWVYEKLVNHRDRLKAFVVVVSCFNAFSVGTNNVANAVGPLVGADVLGVTAGLVLIAPVFGLGSLFFHRSLKTTGERIVPLGLLSATIVCLVTGTLMVTASLLGVPQSFVIIKVAAVFAIGGLKNGHRSTFSHPVTRRMYMTWVITPVVALVTSFLLTGGWHALLKQ